MLLATIFSLPWKGGIDSSLVYAQEDEFEEGGVLPEPTDGGSGDLIFRDEQFEEAEENSDIFLVNTPKDIELVNPTEGGQWRYPDTFASSTDKPGFSVHIGAARKEYGISILPKPKMGLELGLLINVISIPKIPISFKLGGGVSVFNVGAVLDPRENVLDLVYRFGGYLEVSLNRRFQLLFGALHYMSRPISIADEEAEEDFDSELSLDRIRETRFTPGIGAQFEFKVVPYGSMGVLLWAEERYLGVLLSFSMTPVPRGERQNFLE